MSAEDKKPRPRVEDHPYIQALIEGQERRSSDRQAHRDRAKERAERDNLIADSKPFTLTDFWCSTCRADFKAQAVKQVEEDWDISQRIAFYKTKCFRGHWCMRLVTDRHMDGFFARSKLMALDRGNHFADAVQPFESGFNLLYGKRN